MFIIVETPLCQEETVCKHDWVTLVNIWDDKKESGKTVLWSEVSKLGTFFFLIHGRCIFYSNNTGRKTRPSSGGPFIFQQDSPNHTLLVLQQHFSVVVSVFNWSVCCPDLSPMGNIWHFLEWKTIVDINYWAAKFLHQTREGEIFPFQNSSQTDKISKWYVIQIWIDKFNIIQHLMSSLQKFQINLGFEGFSNHHFLLVALLITSWHFWKWGCKYNMLNRGCRYKIQSQQSRKEKKTVVLCSVCVNCSYSSLQFQELFMEEKSG